MCVEECYPPHDPSQGKLQKHHAFEAEVVANKDRIFSTVAMGQGKLVHTTCL